MELYAKSTDLVISRQLPTPNAIQFKGNCSNPSVRVGQSSPRRKVRL
jgi:hypothetical protein